MTRAGNSMLGIPSIPSEMRRHRADQLAHFELILAKTEFLWLLQNPPSSNTPKPIFPTDHRSGPRCYSILSYGTVSARLRSVCSVLERARLISARHSSVTSTILQKPKA